MRVKRPLNLGHRGAMSIAPENTLAAFAAARDAGADGVEFDVQFSGDRQLVVIHDETLERTSDGRGRVADLTLAELKRLDAGKWFDARFAGERIPTLQEVFDLLGKGMWLNIEIKLERQIEADTGLERAIADCVRRNGTGEHVLLSSFNFHSLRRMRQIAPELKIGVLYSHPLDESQIADLRADALHPQFRLVDADLIQHAHARNQQVNVWTVNEAEDMRRMMALGVDAIMTNFPQRLRELLAK